MLVCFDKMSNLLNTSSVFSVRRPCIDFTAPYKLSYYYYYYYYYLSKASFINTSVMVVALAYYYNITGENL